MNKIDKHEVMVDALTDIFERADMEAYYLKQNMQRQGQWRIVMLLAKNALKAVKAPIPETMEQRNKK